VKLVFKRTQRGFARAEFVDLYGEPCSIQASSLNEAQAIWLGTDAPVIMLNDNRHPDPKGAGLSTLGGRMHLDRTRARRLALVLAAFAEFGTLPVPKGKAPTGPARLNDPAEARIPTVQQYALQIAQRALRALPMQHWPDNGKERAKALDAIDYALKGVP
jgi:hypothetical protein